MSPMQLPPMQLPPLLRGLVSYIPGANILLDTISKSIHPYYDDPKIIARYNYSIWLRHLVTAYRNGAFHRGAPSVVAELGPGRSLGTGLAALLSGAEKYYAFDVVRQASDKIDLEVLDELVRLFETKADIPDNTEWPTLQDSGLLLDSYDFPNYLLTEARLNDISAGRVAQIKRAITRLAEDTSSDEMIRYFVPYDRLDVVKRGSVDMLCSRDVMEHVDDLDNTYKAMSYWLKTGGLVSQTVHFSSHGLTEEWNGHWAYSDFLWKLMKGNRPFFINREPYSTHVNLLTKYGFKIIYNYIDTRTQDSIKRKALSSRFRDISEVDFTTKSAFIQAVKT